jgi:hypothetical protein
VPEIFGHQDQRDGRDQHDGPCIEHRRGEGRRAEPGGLGQQLAAHRLAPAETIGEQGINERGHHEADQHQQAPRHAAREHGDQGDAHEGHGLHPGVERRRRHVLDRNGREIEADHRDHGAGYDRRHQPLDPAGAARHHDQADQRVDRAADHDAAQRQRDVGVGALAGIAGGGGDHRDEGEGRADITRDLAADGDKEDQRADATHQDGDVGIEAHQQGPQHGGAEHRHHMLDTQRHGLRPRQPLVRRDDDAVGRLFHGPVEHSPPLVLLVT